MPPIEIVRVSPEEPNPEPATVPVAPTAAVVGRKLVIFGSTVKGVVNQVPPAFVTEMEPVTAAAGIVTRKVPLTSAKAAGTPPTLTELVPVKVVPVNVSTEPVKPCVAASGSSTLGTTLNAGPTEVPPGVTTVTAPVRAPTGTCVSIRVPSGETAMS